MQDSVAYEIRNNTNSVLATFTDHEQAWQEFNEMDSAGIALVKVEVRVLASK
jgi:hypothetical protein